MIYSCAFISANKTLLMVSNSHEEELETKEKENNDDDDDFIGVVLDQHEARQIPNLSLIYSFLLGLDLKVDSLVLIHILSYSDTKTQSDKKTQELQKQHTLQLNPPNKQTI